jgi:hypothetical protein
MLLANGLHNNPLSLRLWEGHDLGRAAKWLSRCRDFAAEIRHAIPSKIFQRYPRASQATMSHARLVFPHHPQAGEPCFP